jgi:hypothetical protein
MDILLLWSDRLIVSVCIWAALCIALLYLARKPAHHSIRSVCRLIKSGFRFAARAVRQLEKTLAQRNREVLLAAGQETSERMLEREFHRINAVVSRDLSGYPNLQRQLNEQIQKIDEDYQQSTEVPPEAPGWTKAVETVAKLRNDDSGMVGKILVDIHSTIKKSQQSALDDYRKSSSKRHQLLKNMMPYWRKLSQTLTDVDKSIRNLEDRSQVIDQQMDAYENMRRSSSQAERTLSSSSLTQFFISGMILAIAMIGGIVNFYLIALPMSEMVGANSVLGPFKASNVAAMVIITLEIAIGIFLMESLRVTRMFPVIGMMDDKMRKRMLWATFTLLLILASVESSLAFMRDLLAADREALRQTLSGIQAANPEFRWIPSVGQMVMGFVLPFALTFVAIPLESFIHASRTVIGVGGLGTLRVTEISLRTLGNVFYHMGDMLVSLYDLLIFIPLRFEELVMHYGKKDGHEKPGVHQPNSESTFERGQQI